MAEGHPTRRGAPQDSSQMGTADEDEDVLSDYLASIHLSQLLDETDDPTVQWGDTSGDVGNLPPLPRFPHLPPPPQPSAPPLPPMGYPSTSQAGARMRTLFAEYKQTKQDKEKQKKDEEKQKKKDEKEKEKQKFLLDELFEKESKEREERENLSEDEDENRRQFTLDLLMSLLSKRGGK